ncbi:MAG: hypothetical protein ONB12_12960 [candidate division KSB1 bacterium]|nr:hypothetical protein [candidate division KSB1 bacterium]
MLKKVILLSGPSCVGKTPLLRALSRTHPEIKWGKPVLCTSRQPRPGEREGVDYHFLSDAEIQLLPRERFVVAKTRHIWQAVDLDELEELLRRYDWVIYDVHPVLAAALREHPRLKDRRGVQIVRVFIQPASLAEIEELRSAIPESSLQEATAALMTPKLIARALQQGTSLTPETLHDIRIRAARAWEEILIGASYDYVLINHDGEDSPHWQETPPSGDAGRTLEQFLQLIVKKKHDENNENRRNE